MVQRNLASVGGTAREREREREWEGGRERERTGRKVLSARGDGRETRGKARGERTDGWEEDETEERLAEKTPARR